MQMPSEFLSDIPDELCEDVSIERKRGGDGCADSLSRLLTFVRGSDLAQTSHRHLFIMVQAKKSTLDKIYLRYPKATSRIAEIVREQKLKHWLKLDQGRVL